MFGWVLVLGIGAAISSGGTFQHFDYPHGPMFNCHQAIMDAKDGKPVDMKSAAIAGCAGSVRMAQTHPENVEKVNFDLSDIHLPQF